MFVSNSVKNTTGRYLWIELTVWSLHRLCILSITWKWIYNHYWVSATWGTQLFRQLKCPYWGDKHSPINTDIPFSKPQTKTQAKQQFPSVSPSFQQMVFLYWCVFFVCFFAQRKKSQSYTSPELGLLSYRTSPLNQQYCEISCARYLFSGTKNHRQVFIPFPLSCQRSKNRQY